MAESEEELKSLLTRVKKLAENSTFIKQRSWDPVPSLHGKLMGKQWDTLFSWAPKIFTADGDCSHEIKRPLLLGRKAMTNRDNVLKGRDIILPTKVRIVKAMVFPLVMYRCESWTIKKAEHRRTDAFQLWCWRRLLRVAGLQGDQTSQSKGNQSWIFIGRTDTEAENPILWPPDVKSWLIGKDTCWERLRAGGEGDDRGWDGWMASLTWWTWVWANSGR